LCATDDHVLTIGGTVVGKYHLIGVMLYKLDAHYITQAYDARERSWVRYDGYPPAKGLGQRDSPPTGRVDHEHGLEGKYYPVDLLYVRVP